MSFGTFCCKVLCMNYTSFSRRSFLKTLGAATLAAPFITRNLIAAPPSERVRFASFGTANMARADINAIISHPNVDYVAAADVDTNYLRDIKSAHPDLKVYRDYRELLDKEKDIDCLNVSTPDHTHAIMAMSAMKRGIHIYCQKPMAHDLYEVRKLTQYAAKHKIITQMGIQIHSHELYRNTVKLIQEGIIGKIKETWSWQSAVYGSKEALPTTADPIPSNLDWDLWLNVAKERPYLAKYYHPGVWRHILDLGTGAFGDFGCHIFDNVFAALKLKSPISVRSECDETPNQSFWQTRTSIDYIFPGTEYTADKTIHVHWYDGAERPPKEIIDQIGDIPRAGSLFMGTDGFYLIPHWSMPSIFKKNGDKYEKVPEVEKLITLPANNHWHQFINAVRGEDKTTAGFDYAGPLTEGVLLGSVACRFPHTTLKWKARSMKFDLKEANKYVKRDYRPGWGKL